MAGHIEAYTNGDLDTARGNVADDERYSQFQRGLSRVEPRREERHVQGLMRTTGVVFLPPCIQRGLQCFDALEPAVGVQQFDLERLVETLDLPGGGQ